MTIDTQRTVSELLRSADKAIKDGNLDNALAAINKVFDFDQRNVYARAYQERILSLKEMQMVAKANAAKIPTPVQESPVSPRVTTSPLLQTVAPATPYVPPSSISVQQIPSPIDTKQPVTGPTDTRQPVTGPTDTRQPVTGPTSTNQHAPGLADVRQQKLSPTDPWQPATVPTDTNQHAPGLADTRQPATVPTDTNQHAPGLADTRQPATVPTDTNQHAPGLADTWQPATVPTDTNQHAPGLADTWQQAPGPTEPNQQTYSLPETNHQTHSIPDTRQLSHGLPEMKPMAFAPKQSVFVSLPEIGLRAPLVSTTARNERAVSAPENHPPAPLVQATGYIKHTPARLEAYKTLLAEVWTDNPFSVAGQERIADIRQSFAISDNEHTAIEREVRSQAYLGAIEQAWKKGITSFDEMRKQFHISDQEHIQIEGRVFRLLQTVRSVGTVLLIDDDPDFLRIAGQQLTEAGYYCVTVSSCEEALSLLVSLSPNVVVCDVNFSKPNMSGFAFYEKFRTIDRLLNVPFLFLSGMTQEAVQRTGLQMGADSYFTKPIDLELLFATIEGKIKRSSELQQRLSSYRY